MSLQSWLPLNEAKVIASKGLNDFSMPFIDNFWVEGSPFGRCLLLNNRSLDIDKFFITSNKPFSFSIWIKSSPSEETAVNKPLFQLSRTITVGTMDGNIAMSIVDPNYQQTFYMSETLIDDNKWHNIVLVNDDNNLKLYFDNSLLITADNNILYGTEELILAASGYSETFFIYYSDVRLYDHILSKREMEDIYKGLCLHYRLNGLDENIEYDYSGFGYNATKHNITIDNTASSRHTKCSKFNGTNSYILANDYTGIPKPSTAITLSVWVKPEQMTGASQIISTYQTGGVNISLKASNVPTTGMYINGGYKVVTSPSAISYNEWHHLAATYDSQTIKLYVDGVMVNSLAQTMPITYNASTPWGIGVNPAGSGKVDGYYYKGYMSDVHIYATALTEANIKGLYETSMSIDKNKNIYAYEFCEDDSALNISSNGVVYEKSLNEMSIKTLSDGSQWLLLHYLDLTDDKTCFANTSEVARCVDKPNRYSLMGLAKDIKSNNQYEYLLEYPDLSQTLYNRWTQTSSPEATTVTGFKAITTAWSSHNYGLRKQNTASRIYDCDTSTTWFAPIGQLVLWNDGIPAADGNVHFITALWTRIDNLDSITYARIFKDKTIQANAFLEI